MTSRSKRLWRVFAGCCLIVTTASVVTAVTAYQAAQSYYRRELEVRLDPLGSTNGVKVWASGGKGPRVVLIGDSRVAQWPVPSLPMQSINLGISHQTTAQVRLRAEQELSRLKPDLVIIQAGVNDLKAVSVIPSRQAEIEEACLTNLKVIADLAAHHGAEVVMTTIFPSGSPGLADKLRWNRMSEESIRRVNSRLRQQYPEILDAAKILSPSESALSPDLAQDLLHLTPKGYARLNAELESALKSKMLKLKHPNGGS